MKFSKLLFAAGLSLTLLCGCSDNNQKALEKTEDYAAESMNKAFNELGEETKESAEQTTKMQNKALHGSPSKSDSLEQKALEIVE